MRQVESWAKYFKDLAEKTASRSKDPSTQVGAVLVDTDKNIVATGYNGFPSGITETPERWERPGKYDLVIHAECNAIARAAKRGVKTDGCILFVTHFPCLNCAKTIIAAGIQEVAFGQTVKGWDEDHKKAYALMREAKIEVWPWGPNPTTPMMDTAERFNVIIQ